VVGRSGGSSLRAAEWAIVCPSRKAADVSCEKFCCAIFYCAIGTRTNFSDFILFIIGFFRETIF
jgi:hypothetical protein